LIEFAMDAMHYYLRAMRTKKAPMVKALGSEELVEKYAKAQGELAKKWWSNISEEERRERAQRAAQARWGNKQEEEPPTE
jgi:hypothetical protein